MEQVMGNLVNNFSDTLHFLSGMRLFQWTTGFLLYFQMTKHISKPRTNISLESLSYKNSPSKTNTSEKTKKHEIQLSNH
jgi:hypothetical protein